MIHPKFLRNIAVYGVSLPTFAAPVAAAKATVYMPSHVAARMLGGHTARQLTEGMPDALQAPVSDETPHAA